MRKTLTIFLLVLAGPFGMMAQMKPLNFALPSPNASSLGTFGEVPVSYFTGLPQISTPLYLLGGQKVKMPMSLDYHAQGIRPDLHPGWVGSGWNLTIGGAITRVPKHGIDEYNNTQFGQIGYYFRHSWLNNANWSATSTLQLYPITNPVEPDEEPDEFSFNFMGYSGKFFLDQAGNWQVQSDKPLKVIFNSTDLITPFLTNFLPMDPNYISKAFKKFTIIDEKGDQYIFGNDETAIEYSDNLTSNGETLAATSWFLTQVISADGSETMNLQYERGPFVTSLSPYSFQTGVSSSGGSSSFWSLNNWSCTGGGPGGSGYAASYVSPVYLKTVTFPAKDLKMSFATSKSNDMVYTLDQYRKAGPQVPYGLIESSNVMPIPWIQANPQIPGHPERDIVWLKLDNISISNIAGTRQLRTISLSYRENATSRLSLNDLYISDGENTQIQHYHYDYNSTPLPPYLGCIDDHWGFYNGSSFTDDYTEIGPLLTVKAPDGNYAQAEILQKITYPTGGFSSFSYELNGYSQVVRRDRTGLDASVGSGGGLRVKTITSDDGNGNTLTKQLYYVKGYTAGVDPATLPSSGILNAQPQYTFHSSGTTYGGNSFDYWLLTSTPVMPLTINSAGTVVGYSEVVEMRPDNSYTIYQFTNHDNGYADVVPVNSYNESNAPYIPTTSLQFERGKPLASIEFDNNGVIIHKKVFSYTTVGNTSTNLARSVYWSVLNICSGVNAGAQVVIRSAYTLPYYGFMPATEAEYTYQGDVNHFVGIQKTYTYDGNKLINSTSYTNSKGQADYTTVTHPGDYAVSPYTDMVSRNMLDFEIDKQEYVNSVPQERNITNYRKWSNSVITPELVQRQLKAMPVQDIVRFYNYDGTSGNPLELSNANDGRLSYIWDYSAAFPVAEAKNASYADIAYTSFEADGTGGWSGVNTSYVYGDQFCVTGSSYYNQPNFSLSKGSLTNSNHYTVTYWSRNGSYTVNGTAGTAGRSLNGWTYYAHTVSPSSGTVTVTGSGAIDELRLYPATAQMTTFTFDKAYGMTAHCDENNRITYYNYDAFGRLILVKDQDGNILKKTCYTYNGQTESCNLVGNDPASQTLNSQGCGGNYVPGSATYTVAANTYYAGSKPAANTLAQNELAAHAQNYVNQHSSCTFLAFYVRIEFTQNYSYQDAYTTEHSTDPYVRFYADAACTIPFTIPANIDVTLNTRYQTTDEIPSTNYYYSSSNDSPVILYGGATEYEEGFMDLLLIQNSGYETQTETFSLLPGTYYTIVNSITL